MQSPKKGKSSGPERGRPRFDLNLGQVEKLCALGCTHVEIAEFLSISQRALYNWLADDERMFRVKNAKATIEQLTLRAIMDRGYAQMKISIRRQQLKLAESGNATMLIWLGKQVLGQKDKIAQEIKVKDDGGPRITLEELLSIYRQSSM